MAEKEIDGNFEKLKKEKEAYYKNIGKVFCPYLQKDVTLNSKGLEHIKFKEKRKARRRDDQFMRFKNVHLIQKVLRSSKTLQEIRESHEFVEIKTNKRNEEVLKRVVYYAFIAIVEDEGVYKRLKIIVKKVDGGELHFWSIIPFWKNNNGLKKMYSGNLNQD